MPSRVGPGFVVVPTTDGSEAGTAMQPVDNTSGTGRRRTCCRNLLCVGLGLIIFIAAEFKCQLQTKGSNALLLELKSAVESEQLARAEVESLRQKLAMVSSQASSKPMIRPPPAPGAGAPHASASRLTWMPADDACDPGQREADAGQELFCAADSALTGNASTNNGGAACGGVPLRPGYCLLPTNGVWKPTPASASAATVRRFGKNHSGSPAPKPRCKTTAEVLDGAFQGEPFDREWVPKTCSLEPLDPFAWGSRKCETTVAMIGDSHIRNLYTATINGLRGRQYFAEAHPAQNIKVHGVVEAYNVIIDKDGRATDRIDILTHTDENEPHPFAPCACDQGERCLRVTFVWAPTFDEQVAWQPILKSWNVDLYVAEPGNAYEHTTPLAADWTAAWDDVLRQDESAHFALLHWSWGKQPGGRREAISAWIGSSYSHRKSYWEQSKMNGNTRQGAKTWHFACGLKARQGHSDEIEAYEPCTDETDTAQLRAIVTVHWEAFAAASSTEKRRQLRR